MQQSGNRKENRKSATSIIFIKRENAEHETSGEARSQVEKDQSPSDVTEDDPNETLYHNPINVSEQPSDVEEGEVTEATKSESETFAYPNEQSEEEEGEVVPEKVPIQGEASWEISKKKTRSRRVVKRPEWLGQDVLLSTIEQKKNVDEEPEI